MNGGIQRRPGPTNEVRHCGSEVVARVAFHYGHKWQYTYSVGDQLKWGGNDEGEPGHRLVVVRGYGLRCPSCGHPAGVEDFQITIRDGVIERVEPASYPWGSAQNFSVIEE